MSKSEAQKYFLLSIITFFFFLLEFLSLGVIEPFLWGVMYNNYTIIQKGLHWILTVALWGIAVVVAVKYSNRLDNRIEYLASRKLSWDNWVKAGLLLLMCKVLTYIDWGTLKIIGEFTKKNNNYLFITQYIYYLVEICLLVLIIAYGQKAFELWKENQSNFPFGGMMLAITWGAFHFISTGGDIWNGVSCIFFSVICGLAYISLERDISIFYIFVCIGYLL